MISPDLPIMKSSEDKLNRESFAKSLANVILQSAFPTSFTVGLYGAWGSGVRKHLFFWSLLRS
jgi:predicted KAP-like P-loop ATPase